MGKTNPKRAGLRSIAISDDLWRVDFTGNELLYKNHARDASYFVFFNS